MLLPLAWPFTALLLEAAEDCLELSFDPLLTTFDDPFTNFDVELHVETVAPAAVVAATVSSLGLFSAGSGSVVSTSDKLPFVSDAEEDDGSETLAEDSPDCGGDSVLRFLCIIL